MVDVKYNSSSASYPPVKHSSFIASLELEFLEREDKPDIAHSHNVQV